MANAEHVWYLKQSVDAWNDWRERNPEVQPNLFKANLSSANLFGATQIGTDLSGADLSVAYIVNADLSGANLFDADLSLAHIIDTNLRDANLSKTNLNTANLRDTNLCNSNLSNALLGGSNLSNINLSGAKVYKMRLYHTIFAWVDLRAVEGLDTAIHSGPSSVDVKTVQLPEGETRLHFLRGIGFSDTFIDYYDSLFTNALQYESCFISYAHQDKTLACRLYKDLQDKGVRCWFAPHDLQPGQWYRRGIEDAIYLHSKVLLLLSEAAVNSKWVGFEVETVRNREAREGCELLFPLRLDASVMQTSEPWAIRLREDRHIGDFTNWQNEASYRQHFAELLRYLKIKPT